MIQKFVTLFFAVFISFAAAGQEPETVQVKVSTDKIKIDGKVYLVHVVQKGETLYSISKAYNVTQMEVAMENPDIYLGIRVGQSIKIPVKAQTDENESEEFIYHVVRKGETLFGLSRKYSIAIDDIVAANPDVETGLMLSQVVKIPRQRLNTLGTAPAEAKDTSKFIIHIVQKGEGLYSISRQYNVDQDVIVELNREKLIDGLKLGAALRIPRVLDSDPIAQELPKGVDSLHVVTDDGIYVVPRPDYCDTFTYATNGRPYNVVLLLPLFLKEFENADTLAVPVPANAKSNTRTAPVKTGPSIPAKALGFLEFYEGFLLAVDSLRNAGLSVNLTVFDTRRDVENVASILQSSVLRNADLIVGPVYPECLKPVADFVREHRIHMVSPLSSNDYLQSSNPYLFQVNPSFYSQLKEFSAKIDLCSDRNIVLMHEADSLSNNLVISFRDMLKQDIARCANSDSVHYKEVAYKAGGAAVEVQSKISHSLVHDKENVLLVPSENEAFVADLLGHLYTLTNYHGYRIKVYGLPRWQKFKNVQLDYYYNLQLHLFTPFFVDYHDTSVKRFVAEYRHTYRGEPSQYAFQGYDVGFYFLSAMMRYGVDYKFCLPNFKVDLLQANYRFVQDNSVSGFENRSVFMIRYTRDFDIIKAENDLTKQNVESITVDPSINANDVLFSIPENK
ncbi:MAG: LysM peptidoglycan-binding domain-containing protein [Bacteroidales bacterium]|nr:LysM peptidoglycan-binding domain-containing protein [Bacteroidales bacterium]MBN2748771.1 LysM peptidoglycan-binding domain-containing protein [Bacteroidales bacterium]